MVARCLLRAKRSMLFRFHNGDFVLATAPASRPNWLLPVAALGVLWNVVGVTMYLSSVGVFGDPMASLNEGERAAASSIPGWVMGAFAIGTFTGLIGSVGLLLRKAWSQPVLIASLVALMVLEGWIIFFSGALEMFGLAVPLMVVAGAILLAWLATAGRRRGWLT